MGRILTESEVASTGGINTANISITSNKCCTRARAEELNCTVTDPSGAATNQLVCGVSKTYIYELGGIAAINGSKPSMRAYVTSYRYLVGTSPDSGTYTPVSVWAYGNIRLEYSEVSGKSYRLYISTSGDRKGHILARQQKTGQEWIISINGG